MRGPVRSGLPAWARRLSISGRFQIRRRLQGLWRCYKRPNRGVLPVTPVRRSSERHVVRFENVGLRYGLGPEVLRDLSFRIEPHSFQFLTGPSGAGKTSLMRLLFLSLRPTRGLDHAVRP